MEKSRRAHAIRDSGKRRAMVIANYYFAGPLFFGMSTGEMLKAIPWQLIFGWNAIQGALEYTAAWIIAYRFKIAEKYGKW